MPKIAECECGALFAAESYQRRCFACRTTAGVCERCGGACPPPSNGYTRRYCDGCVNAVRCETLLREKPAGSGRRLEDLTGRVYGRWTVIRQAPRRPGSCGTMWLCRCGCGVEAAVAGDKLKQGRGGSAQCRPCARAELVRKPCRHCGVMYAGTKRSRYCTPNCREA